jgi:hypothetical protein
MQHNQTYKAQLTTCFNIQKLLSTQHIYVFWMIPTIKRNYFPKQYYVICLYNREQCIFSKVWRKFVILFTKLQASKCKLHCIHEIKLNEIPSTHRRISSCDEKGRDNKLHCSNLTINMYYSTIITMQQVTAASTAACSLKLHTVLATVLPTQFQVLGHSSTHDEYIWITHTCPSVWLSL